MRKKLALLLVAAMCLLATTAALAYNGAPMLRVKVATGELPPVEERLPEDPSVLEPLEEIGQYGGTLHVFNTDETPWNDMAEGPERAGYLARFAKDGVTVVGDLAKGFELSEDAKSLTIYLRKGVKWSDGAPFTADDIVFMFEALHWNDKVTTWNVVEEVKRVKKIDDYTVRLETDEPAPLMLVKMTSWIGSDWVMYHPKHYLKKWHIKYNPKANELAKEEGFDNWWDCFYYHYWWVRQKDLDKPSLQSWILKEFTTTYKVFERNPYYWAVDTEGNQLPYIDRIICHIVNPEVYQMKVISGEADVAYMGTTLADYPLYKENEDEGGYRVVSMPGVFGTDLGFGINQNHSDPALREIFQDAEFRRALSLAINREEINDTFFFGLAVPCQATVLPTCSYYKKEWGEAYAQYDPDEANRLLDEVGLTERDKNGFRIGPDGKALLLLVEYSITGVGLGGGEVTGLLELVKEFWEDIGLKVLLKPEDPSLFGERKASLDHSIIASPMCSSEEIANYVNEAELWHPGGSIDFGWCPTWDIWIRAKKDVDAGRKTLEDFEGGKLPGEEPPEEIKKLEEWVQQRNQTKLGSKEYIELSQKIFDFHAEKLFMIGTVGMAPTVYIAKKNVGNIPKVYGPGQGAALTLNWYGRQLFFKQ